MMDFAVQITEEDVKILFLVTRSRWWPYFVAPRPRDRQRGAQPSDYLLADTVIIGAHV